MKYAFMSFSCPALSLDEMIDVARRYGYEGIEPRIGSNHNHGIEPDSSASFRRECKQKLEESGIAACCIATSCRYADPQICQEMIKDTHTAIDLAADVDAARIRVFGGPIPQGVARKEAIGLLVDSLGAVAEHADQRGVIVCMETHDDWCNPQHLLEVMQKVNHPAIAVNWDIMHPVRVGKVTIDESFRALEPWIRHVHFHDGITKEDGNLALCPIGNGEVDHQSAVRLLKTKGYDGFVSGEWIDWEPYELHLPRELAQMKQYESQTRDVV